MTTGTDPLANDTSTSSDGIHNITELFLKCPSHSFSKDAIPKSGTTVKIQHLILLVGAIGHQLLGKTELGPSKPSISTLSKANPAHKVQVVPLGRSRSPRLFLTREMLDCEVEITPDLFSWLRYFSRRLIPTQIDKNSVAMEVLFPLLHLWLMIWTDAFEPESEGDGWAVRTLVPGDGGGGIGLLVAREQEAGSGKAVDIAAVEVKTPRSCGDVDILNFGASGDAKDDAFSRQCIRQLMHCDKSVKSSGRPWSRHPVFGAFVVYPGHFFPVAYEGDTNRFLVCSDATDIDEKWPEVKGGLQNHMKVASVMAAWAFMLVVHTREDHKQRWSKVCQEQVDQAVQWATTAGEQLASPNRVVATLMRCWVAISAFVWQAVFWFLVTLIPLERFQSIMSPNGDVLVVDTLSVHWRLPINLRLPLPDSVHKSYTATTFVFSSPNIVVKVYDDAESYAHELAFYEKWGDELGSTIPILRASGHSVEERKPFLVLSNEGQPIKDLTEKDRANIQQKVLDVIHGEGWHHHDLAPRNVLQKASGELCLIDFGLASKCDRKGCDAFWE